jgi:hypothetical protein
MPENGFEQYEHHGKLVWCQTRLKGKFRGPKGHCLCTWPCALFKPGQPDNCRKAQRNYEMCLEEDLVTPVYECVDFIPYIPEYKAKSRIRQLFRLYRGFSRKWWQHPRWHFWHWRFQIHPLQKFKRRAFSRCYYCGGRLKWNEPVIGLQWYNAGPKWFRNTKKIAHSKCFYKTRVSDARNRRQRR